MAAAEATPRAGAEPGAGALAGPESARVLGWVKAKFAELQGDMLLSTEGMYCLCDPSRNGMLSMRTKAHMPDVVSQRRPVEP